MKVVLHSSITIPIPNIFYTSAFDIRSKQDIKIYDLDAIMKVYNGEELMSILIEVWWNPDALIDCHDGVSNADQIIACAVKHGCAHAVVKAMPRLFDVVDVHGLIMKHPHLLGSLLCRNDLPDQVVQYALKQPWKGEERDRKIGRMIALNPHIDRDVRMEILNGIKNPEQARRIMIALIEHADTEMLEVIASKYQLGKIPDDIIPIKVPAIIAIEREIVPHYDGAQLHLRLLLAPDQESVAWGQSQPSRFWQKKARQYEHNV